MILNRGKTPRRSDFSQFGIILGAVVPASGNPSEEEQQLILWANTRTDAPILGDTLGGIDKNIGVKWTRVRVKALVSPLLVDTNSAANPMNYPAKVEWLLYACPNKPLLDYFPAFNDRPLATTLPTQYWSWARNLLSGNVPADQILDFGIKPIYPHRYVVNSNTLTPPIYTMTVAVSSGEGGGEFTTVRDISLSSYGNSFGGGDKTAIEIDIDKCFDEPLTITADCQLRMAFRLSCLDRDNAWWTDKLAGTYGVPTASVQVEGHVQVDYIE